MGVIQHNEEIIINGVKIPPCPNNSRKCQYIRVINDKVYVNGYEWCCDTGWRRTFLAFALDILSYLV